MGFRSSINKNLLTSSLKKNNGSYILILELRQSGQIKIGSLGFFNLPCGYYFYVGSAKNGILQRVRRHLRSRTKHWHIDYLKEKAEIISALAITSPPHNECILSKLLGRRYTSPIKGFGSSDCSCFSHLFFLQYPKNPTTELTNYLKSQLVEVEIIKRLL